MNGRTIALIAGPLILVLAVAFQLVLMGLGAALLVRKRKSGEPFAGKSQDAPSCGRQGFEGFFLGRSPDHGSGFFTLARSLLYLSSPMALLAGVMGGRREERRVQPREMPEIRCPWCGEPLAVQGSAGIVDWDGQWEAQTDVYVCSNGHRVYVSDGERERESPFAVAITVEDDDLERYQQAVARLRQIGEATETASGGRLCALDEEGTDLWRELGETFTDHLTCAGLVDPLVSSSASSSRRQMGAEETGDDQ